MNGFYVGQIIPMLPKFMYTSSRGHFLSHLPSKNCRSDRFFFIYSYSLHLRSQVDFRVGLYFPLEEIFFCLSSKVTSSKVAWKNCLSRVFGNKNIQKDRIMFFLSSGLLSILFETNWPNLFHVFLTRCTDFQHVWDSWESISNGTIFSENWYSYSNSIFNLN